MNGNLYSKIPSAEPDEIVYLQALTSNLSPENLSQFIAIYNNKRKKVETVLLCCLLGFVAAAGIQRFLLGQIGMGILYLFTGGLCLVGTIVDIVNHKSMTFDYNQKMAIETMGFLDLSPANI